MTCTYYKGQLYHDGCGAPNGEDWNGTIRVSDEGWLYCPVCLAGWRPAVDPVDGDGRTYYRCDKCGGMTVDHIGECTRCGAAERDRYKAALREALEYHSGSHDEVIALLAHHQLDLAKLGGGE